MTAIVAEQKPIGNRFLITHSEGGMGWLLTKYMITAAVVVAAS